MLEKILIENPFIVSNAASFGSQKGSVFIEGETITRVIMERETNVLEELRIEADEVIDAENYILMPGMINSHYHSYTNLFKGTVNDLPLELWTLYTVAYGHALEDEDVYYAVLLGCIEMMKAGVTSCLDHFPHIGRSAAALSAYEESGMRIAFAPMMHDVPDEVFFGLNLPESLRTESKAKSPEEMRSFYQTLLSNWHNREGRIEIQLGPNAPQRCSQGMLKVCKELSVTENLRVHTHLLETNAQRLQGEKQFEGGLIGYLDQAGLLNEKLSVAHAIWLNREEIDRLIEQNVSIVHNPASNLLLGSGVASIPSFIKNDASVAIGTDGSNCGTNQNLFEAMRLTTLIHRVNEPDYQKWMKAEDVLRMATHSGANVLGKERELGEIATDHKADLVLLDSNTSLMSPLNDPVSQLVHQENGQSVHSVMVNGKWTVREGKLVAINEEQVLAEVRKRQASMLEKCREPLGRADKLRPYFEQIISK